MDGLSLISPFQATLANQISSLTTLKDTEIAAIIEKSGIKREDFAAVLKEVKDATKSNAAKANAVAKINKGVASLVEIATKLL